MQEYVSWNIKNECSCLRTKALRFENIENRDTKGEKGEGAEVFSVLSSPVRRDLRQLGS